jgi:hypothetical protein
VRRLWQIQSAMLRLIPVCSPWQAASANGHTLTLGTKATIQANRYRPDDLAHSAASVEQICQLPSNFDTRIAICDDGFLALSLERFVGENGHSQMV